MSNQSTPWIRWALCLWMVLGTCVAQGQMEPIDADYRNVRGMNFIPTYRNIATLLGVPSLPTLPAFNDTASAAAAWAAYNYDSQATPVPTERQDVMDQLQRIHDVGFNTVRVWLSFHYYRFYPTEMQLKFQDFLGLCQAAGLHVIPILWDADFHEPDPDDLAGTDYKNFFNWIESPGNSFINANEGQLEGQNVAFIQDMLNAASAYWVPPGSAGYAQRTVLLWDVMNEPLLSTYPHQYTWVVNTLDVINQYNTNIATTVTPPQWLNEPLHASLAGNANLDVMAFNFYAYGRRDIERKCDNASNLLTSMGEVAKPILVMEAGLLGAAQPYAEAINLLTKVPATFTGSASGDGVGFCLFSASVGNQVWPAYDTNNNRTQVNFAVAQEGCGLFYGPQYDDRTTTPRTIFVRDYGPNGSTAAQPTIAALGALAPWGRVLSYASMPPNDPDYRMQQLLPGGDGIDRPTVNQMLIQARNAASQVSGLATHDWSLTVRELRLARQIGTWSFLADSTYRLSSGSGLLALSPTGQPQASWQMLNTMLSRHDNIVNIMKTNPALWYTDSGLQADYLSLFHDVHHYWYLGGFDVLYP